jgi:hypothetical protein
MLVGAVGKYSQVQLNKLSYAPTKKFLPSGGNPMVKKKLKINLVGITNKTIFVS